MGVDKFMENDRLEFFTNIIRDFSEGHKFLAAAGAGTLIKEVLENDDFETDEEK